MKIQINQSKLKTLNLISLNSPADAVALRESLDSYDRAEFSKNLRWLVETGHVEIGKDVNLRLTKKGKQALENSM